MKTISKTAVAVAAGMLFSMGSALAADLGGNCCADLEERVAELEATTARKGNRKMSLTISGQVNRLIMSYDGAGALARNGTADVAGRTSNTYWGIDNTNSSSRFNLGGNAKIDATRKAGFNMTIEINSGARSATVNQATTGPGFGAGAYNANDQGLGVRDANVWIEDSRLGRVTLGRLTNPSQLGMIDLGGIGVIAPGTSLIGNALAFSGDSRRTIGSGIDNGADNNKRMDGVKYETPTWQGFQAAFAYGEASSTLPYSDVNGVNVGNTYAASLKYANEFNGVRLAAAIGIENFDEYNYIATAKNGRNWGVAGSLMHVATGLFVQAAWQNLERENTAGVAADTDYWHISAGVTRNWFGIGNTSLYGEYGDSDNGFGTFQAAGAAAPAQNIGGVSYWGLGVVQNIDAAAMELYAGYRAYDSSIAADEKIGVFAAGARIKF